MAVFRTQQEEWSHNLRRVSLREIIRKNLDARKSLSETKRQVQDLKASGKLDKAINDVLSSEFIVNPKRAQVARELSAALERTNIGVKNLAVIILGSGVHGGSAFRDISGNYDRSDLDWGIMSDNDDTLDPDDRDRFARTADRLVPQFGKDAGLGDHFESCSYYNARMVHGKNFADEQQCLDHMLNLLVPNRGASLPIGDSLYLAFYPSFPPEVNEKNRRIVLAALRELSRRDRVGWRNMIEAIIQQQEDAHWLKGKHLVSGQSNFKTTQLTAEVEMNSKEMMSKPFRALLESTAI